MKATVEDIVRIISSLDNLTFNSKGLLANKSFADQGVDSLDRMSIYLNIEESYGVKIPDDVIDKLVSVEKIVEYLNSI